MTDSINHHLSYRYCNRGGAIYLLVEGFLWIVSASLGKLSQIPAAIMVLLVGGMLIHPISLLLSRLFKLPELPKNNPLPVLNTWLALMIPLAIPLVILATLDGRTNLFYPALSILIGAHWLPFTYLYKMKSFIVFAAIFVVIGIYFGFVYTSSFYICGFVVGLVHLIFAVTNFLLTRNEFKNKT